MDNRHRCSRLACLHILSLALFLSACVRPAPSLPQMQSPLPRAFYSPLNVPLPQAYQTYFPIASAAPPDAQASDELSCFGNRAAYDFYSRLKSDSRQLRGLLRCNPSLVAAAQARAQSVVESNHWSHCDPGDKICANGYARRYGCNLPPSYGDVNNVESLGGGSPDVSPIYSALANSEKHAVHLFAREKDGRVNGFFVKQSEVGIAVVEGGKYGWVWAILISECN